MCEQESSRNVCRGCGVIMQPHTGRGRPRKVCASCRPSQYENGVRKKSTHGLPESLPCKHCGTMMPPRTPSRQKTYCCGSCRNRDRSTLPESTCIECWVTFKRRLGGSDIRNDTEPKYCSVECKLTKQRRTGEEVDAIGRIAVKARRWARNYARLQKPPVVAMGDCNHCGCSYERRKGGMRYCSESCSDEAKSIVRERYKKTDAFRSSRRKGKLKRRAIARGATGADSIDPIKVFERDKWTCHICQKRTPRELRGTYLDDAPELDHIVTIADGGSHTWGNVACSCRRCNAAKSSSSFGQLGFGFAV